MADKVRLERDGVVATIVIDRPQARNALDFEATDQFEAAIREAEADDKISALVLWGSGGAFCAGADLREMSSAGARYRPWGGADGPLARHCAKPVVAAVEGHAVAGGLGLALWCDMRVAAEGAVFGVFCRRFGVPMSDGTTVRLPRLIGRGRALDMMLTARGVDAQEALRIGLADRVVPRGEARAAAEQLAREIAAFPPLAMLCDRDSVWESEGLTEAEALVREADGVAAAKAQEAQAGASRFAAGVGRHGTRES